MVSAKLISESKLKDLGCIMTSTDYTCKTEVVNNNREWLYSTLYWSDTAASTNTVIDVISNGDFRADSPTNEGQCGVRPVITISKSQLK